MCIRDSPNTNTNTKIPMTNKRGEKAKGKGKPKTGKGNPRYTSLMSKVDVILDKKSSKTLIATTYLPETDEQLLTNPNINRPNEVSYLFRLPVKPRDPEPLLIVKK